MFRSKLRELFGFVLVAVGVACIPLGWIISAGWLVAGVGLMLVGGLLYMTKRVSNALAGPGGEVQGPGASADVHNYSGWQTGGRRNASPFEGSSSSAASGDGDGD